jgi:predicted hydrocarbon binding protein
MFESAVRKRLTTEFSRGYADYLMRDAGKIAGALFAESFTEEAEGPVEFLQSFRALLKGLGYGVLRVEKADLDRLKFAFSISHGIEPSDTEEEGSTGCSFTEGFLSGALSVRFGEEINVKEIACIAGGETSCRYIAGTDV